MIYVGVLAELLRLDEEILIQTLQDHFKTKSSALEANLKALKRQLRQRKLGAKKTFLLSSAKRSSK